MTKQILLIDGEFRRRATLSHSLEGEAFHVEPFEEVSELPAALPRDGAILIYDEGDAIAKVVDRMTETGAWLPIISFSEQSDIKKVVGALTVGASDYLVWPFSEGDIARAVEASIKQLDSVSGARLREAKARSRINRLTPREKEVLVGVADGLSNRLIGERLSISPRTVEIHRANMLGKMGANHTSEAIRIAIEASLPMC